MFKTSLRLALALSAFFVAAITLSACGGGSSNSVPGDAVASVNGTPITKAEYTRWATITAKGAGGNAAVPDPPTYVNCIAGLRKTVKVPKGGTAPSTATLLAQCKAQNQQVLQQTMITLVQAAWVADEAKQQGVKVSDADVNKQLAISKKQGFPTAAAYNKFLAQSGMTTADVLDRVRVQLLAQRITTKIQKSGAPVTDAQVTAYYNQNRAQFSLPERRDLELVLTKTQAQAQAAKSAVQSGKSWSSVAKKYSTDPASKATGGVLKGVAKGQEDKALDQAAFSATKGAIVGPIKGQFGWYVVRVTAITAPSQTPLAQAKAQIKPLLTQQAGQKQMATFVKDYTKRWTAKTNCRTGYVIQVCKNAPKPKTTAVTAGGTVATPPASTTSGATTTSK